MSARLLLRMETALSFNSLRRVSLYTSLRSNHRRSTPPRPLSIDLHHTTQLRVSIENQRTNLMADRVPSKGEQALQKPEEKEKGIAVEEKPSQPPPPPPPEKPLPGDCCGSGCVRCVWDVYYEELEEYNKLCNSDSGPKP